jgi:hypothetical protein
MSRIVILLDESGSMFSQKYDVIDGVNTIINQQRKLQKKDIYLDIIKFNTGVTNVSSKKLSQTPCFTSNEYNPNGGTALYDAVGGVINKYKNDPAVTMIITTDGMENSSREYKHTDMVKLIEEQRKLKDWKFIYLSEDPTTVQQGYTMGLNNTYGTSNSCIGRGQTGQHMQTGLFNKYVGECSQGYTNLSYDTWKTKM